jgi:hypothetical protein
LNSGFAYGCIWFSTFFRIHIYLLRIYTSYISKRRSLDIFKLLVNTYPFWNL